MSGSRVVITADIAQALREFQRFRAQATNALEAVSAAGSKLSGMMGAAFLGLSAGAFAGWIKGAIDATDAASDLSQKTGIAIEDLAGLELAYQMGGMEAEALASTQVKLSKAMVEGNDGLQRLSISSKNLDGSLKSNKEVMYEVADRFAGMKDGAQKTALAMEIFGKSGADMIPMLNGGSDGLKEMDEMAAKLGVRLSEETVEQAGKFNDTLDLLKLGGQGVARGIAAELLPTLTKLAGSFLQSMTQGDRLKNTAHYLSLGLKGLYSVGVGIVEVFATVGKVIWGLGEIMVNNLKGAIDVMQKVAGGDFKGAWDTIKRTVTTNVGVGVDAAKSIGSGWAGAWNTVVDVWDEGGDKMVETMARVVGASKKLGPTAAEAKQQAAAANKERAEEAKILAELAGVTTSYMEDLSRLNSIYSKGRISQEQYVELVTQLIAKQPGAKKMMDDSAKSMAEYTKSIVAANGELDGFKGQVEEQRRANELLGLSAEAIIEVQMARLENAAAHKEETAAMLEWMQPGNEATAIYRQQAAALRELAKEKKAGQVKESEAEAAKQLAEEGKRASDSIQQSLTDALMRGFESGSGFAENLATTVKNMFKTMVLRPVVSAIVNPVAGAVTSALGFSGTAQAASGAASGAGALGNAGSLLGSVSAMSGAFGSGIASGLSAWGAEGSVMGLLNGGALFGGGIANGLGAIAGALGPIALGIGAAVMIWKKLDTSGTYHAGGAASATSAGVSAVSAGSLNMERIQTNADTQQMVSQLAQGMVGILDSTALAFGKTAGYQAATAFADDTSKDGAWGSLVISKLGQSIVNWQDTRGNGKWSQKTFADGKVGQEQYLAALTASVRTALDSIGLPEWARTMLNGVASDATLEDLAKVVDQINKTQSALGAMRSQLAGFAELNESAVSGLISASGGVEKLFANASAYYDAFYTEAEKNATLSQQIAAALASVNLQMPASKDGYRALVEAQQKLGTQGAAAVSVLLANAGAFAQITPEVAAANSALRSQADILSERTNLQKELDKLTMSTTQQRAQERAALDESNRALYDQVVLQRDLKESMQGTSDALRSTVERLTATRDGVAAYRDSLMMGSLSTLTPMQKYMEAQRQYNTQMQKAMANPSDSSAASAAQEAATAWLTASQTVNASSAAFLADRSKVLGDMGQLAAIAGVQMTDAQRQLSALDKQVLGIERLNDTAISIEQGLANQGMPTSLATPVFDLQRYAASSGAGLEALATEVKALRADYAVSLKVNDSLLAEIRLLRTDANHNADTYADTTEDLVDAVAKEVGGAMEKAVHLATNPTKVAPRY